MAAPITGLRRSEISFRRQGSSGLVWNDKFLTEESESDDPEKIKPRTEERELIKGGAGGELRRSRSDSGRHGAYRTVKVEPAMEDPPSPKVGGCGFCGMLGKKDEGGVGRRPRKHGRGRSNDRKVEKWQ
ncbi:hypothetical protein Drorol1_Dr00011571 [Drosera rotundifolia]